MRKGWTEVSLNEILERSIGGVWGTEPGTDQEEVLVVRSTEFTKSGYLDFCTGVNRSIKKSQLSSRELKEGDILLEKSGGGPEQPVGRVVFVESDIPPKAVCSNFIQLLTPSSDVAVPRFIFLLMWMWHSQNKTLEYQAQTTGIRNLRTSDYLEQKLSLPPLTEQRRIVHLISSVDAYIDALQLQAGSARTARNALLHELLTVGGDDWSETTLGELCEIYQSETISKSQMDDDAPYIVYGANGPVGHYSRFNHSEPEVVVTCRGATCGVVNMTPENCWITGNAMVVKPKDKRSTKGFLYWALQVSVDVQASISGSAQPQITRAGLAPSKIQLPPIAEQQRIVEIVSAMDEVIQSTERAVVDANALRSGLLSDLLSGNHEIPASYDSFLGAA